ncbi:MAG: phosphoglycerate mutase family protein [Robiginitomaculum sp.]|nr:phosphoglycerate mutase family protein [Robiginitomaculum sp.]
MRNIYVVTHTQSEHHIDGLVGGWYDTWLTDLGQVQAQSVAKRLGTLVAGADVELISSDLKRAAQTAEIIGESIGVSAKLVTGLRENSYGRADGRKQNWLDKRIIVAPDDDRLDHLVVEGAESKRTFAKRIYASMAALPEKSDVIVVTHGYALTFVIASWIGMHIEDVGYVNFSATPGGLTHLREDDFFKNRAVQFINDVSHLP